MERQRLQAEADAEKRRIKAEAKEVERARLAAEETYFLERKEAIVA